MKIEYKKDLRHNYMIITDHECTGSDSYCMKLLEYQKIEGILPVEQRRLNESVLYYYDISSRQSMTAILDKAALTKDRIEQLCTGIINTLERAYEYLLVEEDFILSPEYIFMEVVSNEPSLCFLPGYSKPVKEQMSSLLEYLMNKVDYNDREAVLLVYKLYAVSREEGYTFEQLKKELQESQQQDKSELQGKSEQYSNSGQPSKSEQQSKPKLQRDEEHLNKSEMKELMKAGNVAGREFELYNAPVNREESSGSAMVFKNNQIHLHRKGHVPTDQQNTMPMMMEKLEKDVEISCYPLRTYFYTVASGSAGILLIVFSLVTKLIYNTFGDRIDYIKLSALLLIIFCTEGYLIKRIWDKKNKITRIITQNEYIDPRQFIDQPAAEEYDNIKAYEKEQDKGYGGIGLTKNGNIQGAFDNRIEGQNSRRLMNNRESSNNCEIPDNRDEWNNQKLPVNQKKASNLETIDNLEIPTGRENVNSRNLNRDRSALSENNEWDDNPTCLLNPISQIIGEISLPKEPVPCILMALDETNYQSIPVTDFPFFIGKLKKNVDYCLKEDVVSRYHAKLFKEDDKYYLMDMNSTNGTFVNGDALKTYEKIEIMQGDEISFANIRYRLEIGTGSSANSV